ncbi:hypothetical protein M758_11G163200 [Ceratodon purpureus]|uniref:Secreted protein n=1 Tax=Ceratodon purpureus TaxID=3225 RepID=A0A8T0GH69_CERPU|nr:hypothetical protein KC19_11G167400 [Ceratodon purpureus]KAG0602153.1 hypothetical protein M758_11G163200 [Ceratodon purpureus]
MHKFQTPIVFQICYLICIVSFESKSLVAKCGSPKSNFSFLHKSMGTKQVWKATLEKRGCKIFQAAT